MDQQSPPLSEIAALQANISGRTGKSEAMQQAIDQRLAEGKPVAVVGTGGTVIHYPDGVPCQPHCERNVLQPCSRCGRMMAQGKAEVTLPPDLSEMLLRGAYRPEDAPSYNVKEFQVPNDEPKAYRLKSAQVFAMAALVGGSLIPTPKQSRPRQRPNAGTPLPYNPRNEAKPVKGPDRNRPCPCGSGRKAKKCCGGAAIVPERVSPPPTVIPKEMVYNPKMVIHRSDVVDDPHFGSYHEFINAVTAINGGPIPEQYTEFVAGCWGLQTPQECWVAMRQQASVKEMVAGVDFAYDHGMTILEQEALRERYQTHRVSQGDNTQISLGAPSSAAEAVEHDGYEDEGGDANEVSNGCATDQSTDGPALQGEDSSGG